MAKFDKYRGFFMSVFHFAIAMGAFIVFSQNYAAIKVYYPWLIRLMGES